MATRLPPERFLSDRELDGFLAAVANREHRHRARNYAFFSLLANTGLRPSEALALRRSDIHAHAEQPWIRVLRLKKKAERVDELEISRTVAAVLRAFLSQITADAHAPIFGLSRRQAERLFHLYARRCGMSKKRHLYVLRHTAATRIYRATRDIKVVQAVLGHESPETSAIYAHIPRSVLEEVARTVPVFV